MNSYSDSGYQDAGSYYSNQNAGKMEVRLQHSYPGTSAATCGTLLRNSRAEGQTSGQMVGSVSGVIPGRAMRRVSSVPSRTQSPAYGSSISPSRGSLRASPGSAYGSPIVTEPKPLSSIFSSTTLPSGADGQGGSGSSPVRSGMTAVPQHYGLTLPRTLMHEGSDPYSTHSYEIYERMVPRPDSLTGLRASYASQHSHHGPELRSAMSPDRHIGPIYEDRAFQGPLYRSPSHVTHSTLYRSPSGVGNLQRSSSQRSNLTYQRSSYMLNAAAPYSEPYRPGTYRPSEGYTRPTVGMDDGATRSPSIDSIQKDPREFAWRDPELPEVIHMLQHQFPSVQANAAAYLQHLCFGDNGTKAEVCRLGGIKHLVDLLDHKVLEVQRNACGALRNLVYGKATDDNKIAVRNAGGVPALLRLLRKTVDAEVREIVTGVLWNLSSCDAVKMTIVRDALATLTNTVIIPHSGWSSSSYEDDHKLKFHSSLVLRNTTGCLRNLSSAGEEARKQMRCCEGLVDSLLYVIKACVSTSDFDSKIVENCICTLRNLSYRLELEMPPSRLIANQEVDGLLGSESPSKEADYSCWGRKRKKKRKSTQEEQWDGVGPIPGFSKSPKGAEMLWHPAVVKPYLTLLAESSNPATLEGAAGSLQNLSAGNWKFSAYIRAAVRKEKGLPILVELLRMDNDRVVCSVATALRNMALDVRNKELIGKYAMRDLVNRLPGGGTTLLSDETVAAICCTLNEVSSKNMENAKALADTGGIEKLVNITKGRGERYSMKVVKAAAQVLNTLWQYRDLRTIYKKDGWNQNHFLTPVSTLERDRFKSQPTLPSTSLQMSPVHQTAGSATSSPAMLGIKEQRSDYQRTPSSMQFYNYQGDNSVHKTPYTGSAKTSPFYISSYSSPRREEARRGQVRPNQNYESYRMYLHSPQGYDDPYLEDAVQYSTADYATQPHALKTTTNYVDFYSTTRRPSYRAEQYPGSPDSWV
uniref:Plakophilin 4 n=1 Tax=Pygocentrus nattereri TaxID=42514 RepID=A0AAR2K1B2_PYGNA